MSTCCCTSAYPCSFLGCCYHANCLVNTVASDTLGVLWRAASGTVDPWTKNELVNNEANSLVKAGACSASAALMAQNDATSTLKLSNADPSCFWCGLSESWKKFWNLSTNAGMIVIVLALIAVAIYFYAITRRP